MAASTSTAQPASHTTFQQQHQDETPPPLSISIEASTNFIPMSNEVMNASCDNMLVFEAATPILPVAVIGSSETNDNSVIVAIDDIRNTGVPEICRRLERDENHSKIEREKLVQYVGRLSKPIINLPNSAPEMGDRDADIMEKESVASNVANLSAVSAISVTVRKAKSTTNDTIQKAKPAEMDSIESIEVEPVPKLSIQRVAHDSISNGTHSECSIKIERTMNFISQNNKELAMTASYDNVFETQEDTSYLPVGSMCLPATVSATCISLSSTKNADSDEPEPVPSKRIKSTAHERNTTITTDIIELSDDENDIFAQIDRPLNMIRFIDIRPIEHPIPTMKRPVFLDACNVAFE